MDEPTANLDPESAKTVRDFILNLKKEKRTIFLNTHNLDEAQRICDRIGILSTRLIATGAPQELGRALKSGEAPKRQSCCFRSKRRMRYSPTSQPAASRLS